MKKQICLFITILFSIKSFALSVGEHKALTLIAINEIEKCTNKTFDKDIISELSKGVMYEDYNLAAKWASWNHFYNPNVKLIARRHLSDERVIYLLDEIKKEMTRKNQFTLDAWNLVGHTIHQIQDMSAPPHVVPVMHDFRDKYESYEIELSNLNTFTKKCNFLKNEKLSIPQIHKQMALFTLVSIKRSNMDGFWTTKNDGNFGEYGELGNTFGKHPSKTQNQYQDFKLIQHRAALEATKATIWNILNLIQIQR